MKRKPFRYNIILPRVLYRDIKRAARECGLTTPQLVRQFIREGLTQKEANHSVVESLDKVTDG